jgi:hypothetical protein
MDHPARSYQTVLTPRTARTDEALAALRELQCALEVSDMSVRRR